MAPGAARTWGRARRARNKYTVLNTTETIWYGFERAEIRDNGMLVTGMMFGVTYLYWKTSSAKGVGGPTGTALLATNLAQNSDCDHRLGGFFP